MKVEEGDRGSHWGGAVRKRARVVCELRVVTGGKEVIDRSPRRVADGWKRWMKI